MSFTTQQTTLPRHQWPSLVSAPCFRQSVRLGHISSRARQYGITAGRRRIARDAFRRALADLLRQEDRYGVDYVAWVSDLLTRDRQAAMAAGLLTPEDVSRIENEVCQP